MGHRRYVAFVAPRQHDPADDRRLQAQVDVVRRWWSATSPPQVLTPVAEPGTTTRNALAALADQLTQVHAGATVAVYLTGHGDEGPVSTEYRLRVDGGSYDPATLLEAIWDSDADDALVVLDSCYAYRFAQRAANLYGDRVRQPGRTPPRMVLVVPGVATDLRVTPRFEELTDLLAEALRLVSLDDGQVEPYTPLAYERYLTPARLRAALDAAPGELARAGRPGLIRPHVQAFAAEWGDPCSALPNPVYDPSAPVADPATRDLTMSAQTIDEYWPPRSHAPTPVRTSRPSVHRHGLPIVASGSFVVTGHGTGLDRPLIDPRQPLVLPPGTDQYWVTKATGAPAGDPAWYFTGRVPVMTQVVQWLAGASAEPLLVVTGARGTGKSAVLGRAVTLADPGFGTRYPELAQAVPAALVPPAGSVHVAVDARGRTAERVAGLILAALGVDHRHDQRGDHTDDREPESVHERLAQGLRTASATRLDGAPVCVVVDSVDESVQPQALVQDVVAALVRTRHDDGRPAARAVVGVRHDVLDDTDLLGLVEPLAAHLTVRTDDDAADEVRAYCLRLLARPGSPYRDQPDAASAVADLLAHQDQPSFLDARIVAESLSAATATVRVADLDLVGGVLPQALRQALAEQAQTTGRPATAYLSALRALAFARGAGTPWGAVWPQMSSAVADSRVSGGPDDLGNDVLRELLRGPLAAFTMTSSEDGQRVFRPAHATITDVLRTRPDVLVDGLVVEPEAVIEARIARRLGALARDDTPDPYLRRHLVAHAAVGGVLTDDVVPDGFLPWETSRDLRRRLRLPLPDGPTTRALAAWAAVEPHLDQIPTLARRRQALRFALLPTPDADASPLGWRTWTAPRNVLTATTGPVGALAFGQVAGRTLLAGASGHEVRCWDPATGRLVGEPLRGHDGTVLALAFGQVAGRTLLATGSADGTARIWDPSTGEELGVLSGHAGAVWAVTIGRVAGRPVLATGSADQTAQLWDLSLDASQRTWHQPLPHRGAVRAVAFGTVDHQTLLATGCTDGTARLWEPVTSQRVDRPLRHGSRVLAVAFGPVGASGSSPLATSSDDGAVRVWDPATGAPVGRADHPGLVEAITFGHVSGRTLLATGGFDRTARLWDVHDLNVDAPHEVVLAPVGEPLRGHGRSVQALTFGQVADRVVLATGSDDRTLRLWDPVRELARPTVHSPRDEPARGAGPTAPPEDEPPQPTFDEIWRLAEIEPATSDAPAELLIERLLDGIDGLGEPGTTTRPNGLLTVDDTPTPSRGVPWVDELSPPVDDRGSAPLPSRVPVADRSPSDSPPEPALPELALPELASVQARPDQDEDPSPDTVVHTVAFSTTLGTTADRVVLASGGADRTVRLWDPTTGHPVGGALRGHDAAVVAAAFGQAGGRTLLATASAAGTVRLWDPASGQPVGQPMRASVLALAFGRVAGMSLLATGGSDRTVRLWAPATGEPVGDPWTGHQGWVRTVAFGQVQARTVLATGSFDCTARLWDPAGRCLAQLTGHDGPVESVAFGTVDGAPMLATGADDATVRLWDPATGELVGVLTGHGGAVQSVAFGTVDGTTVLATAADDRTVRLWDPATGRRVGDPVPVLVRVHDLAFAPDGRLALATDAGAAVLTPDLLVPPPV